MRFLLILLFKMYCATDILAAFMRSKYCNDYTNLSLAIVAACLALQLSHLFPGLNLVQMTDLIYQRISPHLESFTVQFSLVSGGKSAVVKATYDGHKWVIIL